MTDIIIVRNGICKQIASFPLGNSTLIRNTANSLKQSLETAHSLLNLFEKDRLESKERTKIKRNIDQFFADWFLKYSSIIENESSKDIYFMAHSHSELFAEQIKKILNKDIHIENISDKHLNMYIETISSML